jgi:hypothetical protein
MIWLIERQRPGKGVPLREIEAVTLHLFVLAEQQESARRSLSAALQYANGQGLIAFGGCPVYRDITLWLTELGELSVREAAESALQRCFPLNESLTPRKTVAVVMTTIWNTLARYYEMQLNPPQSPVPVEGQGERPLKLDDLFRIVVAEDWCPISFHAFRVAVNKAVKDGRLRPVVAGSKGRGRAGRFLVSEVRTAFSKIGCQPPRK